MVKEGGKMVKVGGKENGDGRWKRKWRQVEKKGEQASLIGEVTSLHIPL